MGLLGSTRFDSMEDLFVQQLEDIYDAEKRLTRALPKMAEAAHGEDLKQAFNDHLQQTEGHVQRLEQVFSQFGKQPERETCEAMKGLVKEGEEMIQAEGDASVRDAALIAAAQRVEHYEISAYGTLRSHARALGRPDVANVLQQTLDEEHQADNKLTEIAEGHINPEARAA
ncbi:MAG: ferritin-like domain-containing protein [Phycisphaeraceae bacterium]